MKEIFLNLPKGEFLLPPDRIGEYFKVNNYPGSIFVVDIGQPRISSTARAILLASGDGFDEVHFQPWKYIQRYSKTLEYLGYDPNVTINQKNRPGLFLLKETPGGPNDPKENFDPVLYLINAGVDINQLKILIGFREPFAQYESWLKFDETRQARIFSNGQNFILSLWEKYIQADMNVVPYVFDLFYPDAKTYLQWLYNQLGLGKRIKLPDDLKFSENPPVIWHEANPNLDSLNLNTDVGSAYYEQVVKPVITRGRFVCPETKVPNSQNFERDFPLTARLTDFDGIVLLKKAAYNYANTAEKIYEQSLNQGLARNNNFENFLSQYKLGIDTF